MLGAGDLARAWLHIVGPIIGGVLAMLFYDRTMAQIEASLLHRSTSSPISEASYSFECVKELFYELCLEAVHRGWNSHKVCPASVSVRAV